MMRKTVAIIRESLPILFMIGLIPLVKNDTVLTFIYIGVIAVSLLVKRTKNDIVVLVVGFVAMTISESLFIATGVEVFIRNSLFGMMPLWLPFLWAYGFVVMKRSLHILDEK